MERRLHGRGEEDEVQVRSALGNAGGRTDLGVTRVGCDRDVQAGRPKGLRDGKNSSPDVTSANFDENTNSDPAAVGLASHGNRKVFLLPGNGDGTFLLPWIPGQEIALTAS
jgi:hypothetical protein